MTAPSRLVDGATNAVRSADHPPSRSTLVFPSDIGTHWLPLDETMPLASIALAADLPHAGEVLDGYSNTYFFGPALPDELAALMRRVTTESIAKAQVHEAGAPQDSSGKPSWARILGLFEGSDGGRVGVE